MGKENKAFDRWCYTSRRTIETKFGKAEMPELTCLLYRVCNNDHERFNEAIDILQKAFEAGQAAGRADDG